MSQHDEHEEQLTAPDGTPIIQGPDGIQEYDNPMPKWMTTIFWGTILWGVGYLVLFPGININLLGYSQYGTYEAELAEAKTKYQAAEPADPAVLLAKAMENPEAGKAVYTQSCAACHGAEGQGAIGPSLSDAETIYGSEPEKIAHTIAEGTDKGMPPFKASLSPTQLAELTAFVHALQK